MERGCSPCWRAQPGWAAPCSTHLLQAHVFTQGVEGYVSSSCVCSEWYYARSPFLSPQRRAEILGSLYELNGITFHLALTRADLDIAWPMFSE